MYIRLTLFRVGLALVILGSVWIAFIFSNADKSFRDSILDTSESSTTHIKLNGDGIGFYFISSNSYQNNLVAKIIDGHGNYLDIKKITNKITVNYFRFDHSNEITLEVTNLSQNPVQISTVVGDTKTYENTIPAILLFVGCCVLMLSGYRRLRHYITAHPDENNS
jgi:hypothetical protein